MALMDSSNEDSRVWFVSFARRKLGAAIDENNCRILEHALGDRCSV